MKTNSAFTGPFKRRLPVIIAVILLIMAGAAIVWASSRTPRLQPANAAQDTSVPLQFPTNTYTPPPPSETPTRTPTSEGQAMAEAISDPTNIRSGPDIEAARLGTIRPGEQYPILGKRFEWYQIDHPNYPLGTVWVHQSVIQITGDESLIPNLELEDIPTVDPAALAAQETAEALRETPGALITLTARAQTTPVGVFTVAPGAAFPGGEEGAPPPVFTPPSALPTAIIIPQVAPPIGESENGDELPPIVPILVLGALGLLGLLIALIRRL